jgi:hypothetical protein
MGSAGGQGRGAHGSSRPAPSSWMHSQASSGAGAAPRCCGGRAAAAPPSPAAPCLARFAAGGVLPPGSCAMSRTLIELQGRFACPSAGHRWPAAASLARARRQPRARARAQSHGAQPGAPALALCKAAQRRQRRLPGAPWRRRVSRGGQRCGMAAASAAAYLASTSSSYGKCGVRLAPAPGGAGCRRPARGGAACRGARGPSSMPALGARPS